MRATKTNLRPLPARVVSPKSSPAYQAHSYPTKIPPEAIVPFIEASSDPGAVVLDPFCGSGMTGVAALMSGRHARLSDLSAGAAHVASGHVSPVASEDLLAALERLDERWMRSRERDLYTELGHESAGIVRHTIWSEVHRCNRCDRDLVLWDEANEDGQVPRTLACRCGATQSRSGATAVRLDPVQVVVQVDGVRKLIEATPSTDHRALLDALAAEEPGDWLPTTPVEPWREMFKRSALHLKQIETVEDFFLPRAKHALSGLRAAIMKLKATPERHALMFAFTNTAWHGTKMRRYNAKGGQRPMTGTLYIPQLIAEANVFEVFRHQVRQIAAYYDTLPQTGTTGARVEQASATDLAWVETDSVDYIFCDPPFGANIFYADCNLVWEAWLRRQTDQTDEIVVNRSRTSGEGGKSVQDYEDLLAAAFAECARVLKPGGRASVVFHNSDDAVWAALLNAAERADLIQTDVSILDKVQRSMKGYKARDGRELVPFYDLVITFVHRNGTITAPRLNGAGDLALRAVKDHLRDADSLGLPRNADERSREYLYSVAVSGVIRADGRPDGLSFRAFRDLCDRHLNRDGDYYTLT